jgi:asparagine N-glycosylation enzyme membrane subunit Stt3
MELTPRLAGLVALLALLPVVAFGIFRTWWAGAITLVNVVIIAVSLYLLLSPTEEEHGHAESGNETAGDEAL